MFFFFFLLLFILGFVFFLSLLSGRSCLFSLFFRSNNLFKPFVLKDFEDPNIYCICKGRDDGQFMIACDVCNNWFHGQCVGVSRDQSSSISKYVCPLCQKGTVCFIKQFVVVSMDFE